MTLDGADKAKGTCDEKMPLISTLSGSGMHRDGVSAWGSPRLNAARTQPNSPLGLRGQVWGWGEGADRSLPFTKTTSMTLFSVHLWLFLFMPSRHGKQCWFPTGIVWSRFLIE